MEKPKLLAAAALIVGLSFCGSAALAESSSSAYPRVEEKPPAREKPALTVDEQSKLKQELLNARDRQPSPAKAKDGTAQPKSKKP